MTGPTDSPTSAQGPGWEFFAAKIDQWLTANKKVAIEVRWGSFPLGMVSRWIERAEQAEAERDALRAKAALADEQYGEGKVRSHAYWKARYDALTKSAQEDQV